MSWVEVVRDSEIEVLKRGMTVVDDTVEYPALQALASGKFLEPATEDIWKALDIATEAEKHPTTSRILRTIVFSRLRPITDLTRNDFLQAFFDCFQCHHALWENSFRHCDPSLNSLMIDSRDRGVMIDWDLAVTHDEKSLRVLDRTGTMPFMPLELLAQKAKYGEIERFYRHEMETFIWTLVVVCKRFNDGRRVRYPTDIDVWFSSNCVAVRNAKSSYQNDLLLPSGQPSYWAQFYVARSLVWWLQEEIDRRTSQARRRALIQLPPADNSVEGPYKAWWNAVEDVVRMSKDDNHLAGAGDNRYLLTDLGNFLIHDMAARGVAVK